MINNGNVMAMGYWTNPINQIRLYKKNSSRFTSCSSKNWCQKFIRMMTVLKHIEKRILDIIIIRPHWYLNNMVVNKKLRGKGIGTKILSREIQRIKEREQNAVFSLTTQKAENVEFYKKHGFEVVLGGKNEIQKIDFPNWIMCRD